MNEERLMQVLIAPRVSEKATRVGDNDQQYIFDVLRDATKPEIHAAVERMFSVQVARVRVCNIKGKTRVFKRIRGQRPSLRKGYVTLKSGFNIDFMGRE